MSRDQDPYHELASIRANTQASVAFQALQSGLLVQMNHSMNGIHAEMEMVRQQQDEALAIHQELLNREQMQSHLEEFIYQAEKLVAECSKAATDIPLSSRYFLLVGVLGKIKNDGISTSIIKGRENKATFEKVMQDTQQLTLRLKKEPEVQEAISWAEEERQRREAERERNEQERQGTIVKLRKRIEKLQGEMVSVKPFEVFKEYLVKIDNFLSAKLAPWQKLAVQILFFVTIYGPIFGVIISGIMAWVEATKREKEQNQERIDEIAKLNQQVASLIEES